MSAKELFVITEENLETGMRGYPVGYCVTSNVNPEKGLFYCGVSVKELAFRKPEEIIYLLYHGKEGSPQELGEFIKKLQKRATLSKTVQEQIRALPRNMPAMRLFCTAILLAGIEGTGNYEEDCLDLIAKIPLIAAEVIQHHAGWGPCKPSNPSLGMMQNFTQMLSVPGGRQESLEEVFTLFNVMHYDHGGGNLSAFVGKAVASGLEDLYGSIASAMCALAGPRHGKANQDCLIFVKKILAALPKKPTESDVETYLQEALAKGEVIPGFGHAVLRIEDPRATIFYKIAEEKYGNDPLVKMALLLRAVGPRVLKENPKIQDPYPNTDAISGTLLSAAGFPYPEYYTVLFGLARVVGISIQIVYERLYARGGKGTPIIRPKYFYKPRE